MGPLFPPWTNTAARLTLIVLVALGGLFITTLFIWVRTPLFTRQGEPIEQPIEFDHRHHVGDDGIDCRYCHNTVDKSPSAGIPPTALCMNCHSQVWNASPLLAPVRRSFFTDRPIRWRRVHELPGFVYFNHSIHVNKGVGCVTCHGRVDQMAAVARYSDLRMGWCLDCHRDPAGNLRPQDQITSMTWAPTGDKAALARELVRRYNIHTRTSCTTCHR